MQISYRLQSDCFINWKEGIYLAIDFWILERYGSKISERGHHINWSITKRTNRIYMYEMNLYYFYLYTYTKNLYLFAFWIIAIDIHRLPTDSDLFFCSDQSSLTLFIDLFAKEILTTLCVTHNRSRLIFLNCACILQNKFKVYYIFFVIK